MASIIYPSKDATLTEEYPDTNYGSTQDLRVRVWATSGYLHRSLLEFSLSILAGVPSSSITVARLYLDCTHAEAAREINHRKTDSNTWTELGVTWNNQPSSTDYSDKKTWSTGWDYIDILDIVKAAIDASDTVVGFLLKCTDESIDGTTHYTIFESEESTSDPYLSVEFSADKYVDIATGSDSDSGNTWALAYLTVKKGIDNVSSGQTLHIAEGDYSSQAAIDLNKNLEILCEDYGGGNASPPLTVVLPATT